jgi:hypothetical protein
MEMRENKLMINKLPLLALSLSLALLTCLPSLPSVAQVGRGGGPGDFRPGYDRAVSSIYGNFERESVSKDADINLKAVILQGGWVVCSGLERLSPDPKDEFYCLQAMWESAPFYKTNQRFYIDLHFTHDTRDSDGHSCSEVFFQAHKDLRQDYVVIHLIPPSVNKRFPGLLTDTELHSLDNLAGIKLGNKDSRLLDAYRAEWVDYLDTCKNPTRASLLLEAGNIIREHSSLFSAMKDPLFKKWRGLD